MRSASRAWCHATSGASADARGATRLRRQRPLAHHKLPGGRRRGRRAPAHRGEKVDRRALARSTDQQSTRSWPRRPGPTGLSGNVRPDGARVHRRPGRAARRRPHDARGRVPDELRARGRRRRRLERPALEADGASSAGRRSPCPRPTAAWASARSSSAVVVEELGRAVAPGPVPRHHHPVRCPPSASSAAPSSARASSAASPKARSPGSLALVEPGTVRRCPGSTTTATETADGCVLDGVKDFVLEAPHRRRARRRRAARAGDRRRRRHRARASCPQPTSRRARSAPSTRTRGARGASTLDGRRRSAADRVLGTPGPATAHALRATRSTRRSSALAVESVGTCQSMFDITLDYAKQREQFGVPIGSFQAIKHKFADLLVALEKAPRDRPTSRRSRSPRTTSAAPSRRRPPRSQPADCQQRS